MAVEAVPTLSRQRCREYFERRFSATRMCNDYLAVYDRFGASNQCYRRQTRALARPLLLPYLTRL